MKSPQRSCKVPVLLLAVFLSTVALAKESVIFRFNFSNGAYPEAPLTSDAQGNLYGTTAGGGYGCSCGTVFELSPNPNGTWTEKVLYAFTGSTDGDGPITNLLLDAKGNLYGAVFEGGIYKQGGIFELSPGSNGWTEKMIYNFTPQDGFLPGKQLTTDGKGNIYGTVRYNGPNDGGSVFELSPQPNGAWKYTILYAFPVLTNDASEPYGGITLGPDGNLYGAGMAGGINDLGAIYELTPNGQGTWTESVLYSFGYHNDGIEPESPLFVDASANVFGSTIAGGQYNAGMVFELTPSNGQWSETVLYTFYTNPSDGAAPQGIAFAANGSLYGTTIYGGNGCNNPGCGIVFQLAPQPGGSWNETILHQFESANDGSLSYASMLVDNKARRVYGTTEYGGGIYGYGTIFMMEK
jgi:uncharacterized repeat protein (TIGR03803 family)